MCVCVRNFKFQRSYSVVVVWVYHTTLFNVIINRKTTRNLKADICGVYTSPESQILSGRGYNRILLTWVRIEGPNVYLNVFDRRYRTRSLYSSTIRVFLPSRWEIYQIRQNQKRKYSKTHSQFESNRDDHNKYNRDNSGDKRKRTKDFGFYSVRPVVILPQLIWLFFCKYKFHRRIQSIKMDNRYQGIQTHLHIFLRT